MIVTEEWDHTSASQLKTYKECPRKWWYGSVLKVERKDTKATKLGKDTHTLLEGYNKFRYTEQPDGSYADLNMDDPYGEKFDWTDTKAGMLGKSGSHWIHQLQTPFWLESSVKLVKAPVAVVGYIDVLEPRRVTDYKTCKNYSYIPSKDELRIDPQKIIYSQHLFDNSDEDEIEYRHIYINKSRVGSQQLSIKVNRRDNWLDFSYLSEDMEDQRVLSLVDDADDVHYNLNACGNYGGCPFKKICKAVKPRSGIVGLIDRMKKRKSKDTEVAKKQDEYLSVADKARIKLVDEGVITEKQAQNMSVAQLISLVSDQAKGEMDKINPSDGVGPEHKAPPPAAAKPKGKAKKKLEWENAKPSECFKFAAKHFDVDWQDLKHAAKNAGWGKAAVHDATNALARGIEDNYMELFREEGEDNEPEQKAPKKETQEKPEKVEATLYINCRPLSNQANTLAFFGSFITSYILKIEEETGGFYLDPRVEDLDYNRGPKMVAAELAKALNKSGIPPYDLMVDMSHPCAKLCVPILMRYYPNVVQGFVS